MELHPDELSDDEDDDGEIAKRRMQRQATFTAPTSPAGMARSERSGATLKLGSTAGPAAVQAGRLGARLSAVYLKWPGPFSPLRPVL